MTKKMWSSPVVLVGAVLALSGCTAGPSQPIPESTATPTLPSPASTNAAPAETPTEALADQDELPMPVSAIPGWAAAAVPNADAEEYVTGASGWLSRNTSPRLSIKSESLAAGSYVLQFSCSGDGVITATFQTAEGDPLDAGPVVECANSTTAFDVTITAPGLTTTMSLDGAPTVYALSVQNAPTSAP